ncbi:hypothetical protein CRUP_027015 [Coryphaenoides rupestris]|nr:hypothetical protein CRUP_027015 [Coryphaenoides rupestris]
MRKKASYQRAARRDSSPIKPSPNRQTLTYAQAQRIVELEADGRLHRLSIYDKLEVVGDNSPTAQEIVECNSNKENREKLPQVLVRSARLKNSQQKKSGTGAQGPGGAGPQSSGLPQGPGGAGPQSSGLPQGPGGAGPQSSGLPEPRFRTVEYNLPLVPRRPAAFYRYAEPSEEELDEEVEYDLDEEDYAWLELLNHRRRSQGVSQVSSNLFEFLMDRLEKESLGERCPPVDEDAVCCICMDGDGADSNVILFCDACDIGVHQECYGVPYVPEGQWLCRPCMQRPAPPAQCLFCPNRGGALKRTVDNRWGHVACALWVPEVGFLDTVFIEPIDGVGNVPPARWKLTCSLCKEKGAGACIQCHRANCYTAFHVSCAQRAGLYMKMEPIGEPSVAGGATFSIKKTAYCCAHTPEGCNRRPLAVYDQPDFKRRRMKEFHLQSNQELKDQLKEWQRLRQDLERARVLLELIRKREKLKREEVRETEFHLQSNQELKDQLKEWQRLRQDLERARVLLELIRKREKLKREEVRETVPDYLEHIKQPMDFFTMRQRIEAHLYGSLEAFEEDFNLIISNCMTYNSPDSFFHKAACRMQDHSGGPSSARPDARP